MAEERVTAEEGATAEGVTVEEGSIQATKEENIIKQIFV